MSQGLKAIVGVVDAEVSYDEQRAEVKYRSAVVSPEELIAAVEDTGFGASLFEESATKDDGS